MEINKDLFDGVYKKYRHDIKLIRKTQTAFDLCSVIIAVISAILVFLTINIESAMSRIFVWMILTIISILAVGILSGTDTEAGRSLVQFFIKKVLHKDLHTDDISTMRYGEYFVSDNFEVKSEAYFDDYILNVADYIMLENDMIYKQKPIKYKIKYKFQFLGEYMEKEIGRELYEKLQEVKDYGLVLIFTDAEEMEVKLPNLINA